MVDPQRPNETRHQFLMRTDPQYALDVEQHGPDCTWRFDHEECDNGDVCIVDADRLHECGSPEHWT